MNYHPDLPETWPGFTPLIIAHDVGYKRDRSTAVVGGGSPFRWTDLGLRDFQELPQGLCGSDRANALASIDRHYRSDALIVADLSNEPSYGEILYQTFGSRVIGLHITHHGDGMNAEWRRAGPGAIPVYNIGRTHLIEQFLSLVENDKVRLLKARKANAPMPNWSTSRWSFAQAGQSTGPCQGTTTIWRSRAAWWRGRRAILICVLGRPPRLPTGCRDRSCPNTTVGRPLYEHLLGTRRSEPRAIARRVWPGPRGRNRHG